MVVHSGHGLHLYWLLQDGPWFATSSEERQAYKRLLASLQRVFAELFAARGWKLDKVDPTKILRPPGTMNRKPGCLPVPVEFLLDDGPSYMRDTLSKALLRTPGRPRSTSASSAAVGPSAHHPEGASPNDGGVSGQFSLVGGRFIQPQAVLAPGEDPEDRLRRECLAHFDPEIRARFEKVYRGECFVCGDTLAPDDVLHSVCSVLAFRAWQIDPTITAENLFEILKTSMLAHHAGGHAPTFVWEGGTRDDSHVEWTLDKLRRALLDRERKEFEYQEQLKKWRATISDRIRDQYSLSERDAEMVTRPFKVGSEKEIGERELELMGWSKLPHLTNVVADHAQAYSYRPDTGLWSPIHREDLRKASFKYDGLDAIRPGTNAKGDPYQPQQIKIQDRTASAVASVVVTSSRREFFFDEAPPGVAFRNGFLVADGRQLKLLSHSRDNRVRFRIDADYDPAAASIRYDQFLLEAKLDFPTQQFLHEFIGACLFGDIVKRKLCIVLLGSGNNGKSVLLDTISEMYPANARASIAPNKWHERFAQAEFAGKAINIVDEMPSSRIEGSEHFKAIISGGAMQVERKNEHPFQIRPRAGHIFSANALPSSADQTEGWWSRWGVVPFTRQFERHEQDPNLRAKLLVEIPGIVAKCAAAYVALEQRGSFNPTGPMQAAKEQWREESDHALRYCKLRIEASEGPPHEMLSSDVFRNFRLWALEDEGLSAAEIVDPRTFGKTMRQAGFEKRHTEKGEVWKVRLRTFSAIGSVNPRPN
jgi:P4 family phage/plasmid primase-like protien